MLIFIYSMMELLICKFECFWQEVNVEVFDAQVTVNACGPLFFLSDSAKWLDYRTCDTRQQDSVVGDIRHAGKIFYLNHLYVYKLFL